MPKKLPRRVGDVLKFDRKVKIGSTATREGAHQNSRFFLVEKAAGTNGSPFQWKLQDVYTGIVYSHYWRPRYLVKDVFLTKSYRAAHKSDLIHPKPPIGEPIVQENPE